MVEALILLALALIALFGFLTGRSRPSSARTFGIALLILPPVILWGVIWLMLPATPDKGLYVIFYAMPYIAFGWYVITGLGFALGQWTAPADSNNDYR